MANRTPNPSDFFDKLREMERRLNLRIDNRAGFDATQLNRTVAKLEQLVAGLLEQVNGIFSGYVTAAGHITTSTGDFWSPHGRATPVVTSYVAAYFNSDGRLGATPSGAQFKQDVTPRIYTLDDAAKFLIVQYRLIAAVEQLGDEAAIEVGVVAQQLLEAGYPEFVICDEAGVPFTVTYERMVVLAIGALQDAAKKIDDITKRLDAACL